MDLQPQENIIPLNRAIIYLTILIITGLLVFYSIGKFLFWNKPEFQSKTEYDLAVAMENVKKYPQNALLRVELGWAFAQAGNYDRALEEYQNALKIDKKNVAAKYNMALIYLQKNQDQKAVKLLEELIKERPAFTEARLTLGEYYLQTKKYDDALKHFHFVLKANPGTVDYIYLIGQALEGKGKIKEAIQQYELALRYVPDFQPAKEALEKLKAKK
ncbi:MULTISPECIES: lipopolysaccharide assembly protein LapB [Carboxydocella]|uniref:Tetratricopeptide repeat-containing protein n=2 Tax=Carboxydocella TaxID=178898 RepID=A0A1T4LM33_9FIRM|nr:MULTISPECIES: tetratricopeptide repeat protein [Carboxydocella]AVX20523.1 Tetratricopeptide repeat-containing protein [Carboxydocella thermautotrophica]AVX30945.1 Tetratricopeptide repeat-containing protein [Carboxydocella thermautotrophica]GAW31447.1 hypothetical protein JDF658_12120 [Carboxydocella sp. JDF658]SJZ55800.1 Tetratricopeptide repeat-containing protein [Carboxydocella sporoproducens DSM 16521]